MPTPQDCVDIKCDNVLEPETIMGKLYMLSNFVVFLPLFHRYAKMLYVGHVELLGELCLFHSAWCVAFITEPSFSSFFFKFSSPL